MQFNQQFLPGWNALYSNLMNKVGKSVVTANIYDSPFSAMLQSLEVGQYVEDIHINPSHEVLQDTVGNSDIFTDYIDDVAVAVYQVNVDLVFPSTYQEYVMRAGFSFLGNVAELVNSLTANLRTTLEYKRTQLVKQMLYNGVAYGMISCVSVQMPTDKATSAAFAARVNALIDDFRTEINPRYVVYNNQKGMTSDKYRRTICRDVPYVILFNQDLRDTEMMNALNLALVGRFASGNENQDYARRLIVLNRDDFPTSVPEKNRSEITGQNVSATDVNFYEMPTDANNVAIFPGTPQVEGTILGFIIEPSVLKLFTQLEIMTTWLNPATVKTTNRSIYRGIMELGAFGKIAAIVAPPAAAVATKQKAG